MLSVIHSSVLTKRKSASHLIALIGPLGRKEKAMREPLNGERRITLGNREKKSAWMPAFFRRMRTREGDAPNSRTTLQEPN